MSTLPTIAENHVDWQLQRFRDGAQQPAMYWNDRQVMYGDLLALYEAWLGRLRDAGVSSGSVVAVAGGL